jgi:sugar phosphate isomerase/epimerase
VLDRLREIGYEAVEVAGLSQATAERFEEQLEVAGLVACAAHVPQERLTADLSAVASDCRRWGCEYVVIPSLPVEYHSEAGFHRFARESADIAKSLTPFGLELAYHNHAYEFERLNDRTGLEVLFDFAAPDALKAELDTYWIEYAGGRSADWIRRMAGRVPLVHLKDMSTVGGKVVQAEVGEGSLDWTNILNACREASTRWLVVEQDDCAGDPLDSLAISYRNLIQFLAASSSR